MWGKWWDVGMVGEIGTGLEKGLLGCNGWCSNVIGRKVGVPALVSIAVGEEAKEVARWTHLQVGVMVVCGGSWCWCMGGRGRLMESVEVVGSTWGMTAGTDMWCDWVVDKTRVLAFCAEMESCFRIEGGRGSAVWITGAGCEGEVTEVAREVMLWGMGVKWCNSRGWICRVEEECCAEVGKGSGEDVICRGK